MSGIKWETPEPATRGRNATRWADIVEALKVRPGVWALVAEGDGSNASAALKKRGCEVTLRGVDRSGKVAKIYARYVGEVENV